MRRLKSLLLVALVVGAANAGMGSKISSCVLGEPKQNFMRVCIGKTRYEVRRDAYGDYYIERAFKDSSYVAAKCDCSEYTQAIRDFHAKQLATYQKQLAEHNLKYGYIALQPFKDKRKKRKVAIQMSAQLPEEIVNINEKELVETELQCVKCKPIERLICVKCDFY